MAMQSKIDRTRAVINSAVEDVLAAQSQAGYFGEGGVEWTMRDGLVQITRPWQKQERHVKEEK